MPCMLPAQLFKWLVTAGLLLHGVFGWKALLEHLCLRHAALQSWRGGLWVQVWKLLRTMSTRQQRTQDCFEPCEADEGVLHSEVGGGRGQGVHS